MGYFRFFSNLLFSFVCFFFQFFFFFHKLVFFKMIMWRMAGKCAMKGVFVLNLEYLYHQYSLQWVSCFFHWLNSLCETKMIIVRRKEAIITEIKKGFRKTDVAKTYGITKPTLSTLLKNKEKIKRQFQITSISSHRKRIWQSQFQHDKKAVFKRCEDVCSLNGQSLKKVNTLW